MTPLSNILLALAALVLLIGLGGIVMWLADRGKW